MKISESSPARLSFCLNVYPGATVEEMHAAVFTHAPHVWGACNAREPQAEQPFGIGLWCSADVAETLLQDNALERFAKELENSGQVVFTMNGFPYGVFHSTAVKENVYRPDWSDVARQRYTENLIRILARLLPPGETGSISTLPVTYRAWASLEQVKASVRALADIAVFLDRIRQDSGKDICLALEPEPDCYLDTIDSTYAFFMAELFPLGEAHLRSQHGYSTKQAEDVLHRHLGVCLDTTHAGVLFESATETLRRLHAAGIRIPKIQLGGALRGTTTPATRDALAPFAEPVYLHQTRIRHTGKLHTFTDLPQALSAWPDDPEGEARVHFHVPLSWTGTTELTSTAKELDADFFREAHNAGVLHYEVEVYTLDVFPHATDNKATCLAEDILWVRERLLTANQEIPR